MQPLLLAVCILAASAGAFAEAHFPSQLCGTWKVVNVITSTPIVGNQILRVGSAIEVGRDSVKTGEGGCAATLQERQTQSLTEFREGYRLDQQDMRLLALPSRVVMYDTECLTLIPKSRSGLIIEDSGVFWWAVRTSNTITSKENDASSKPLHSNH
jgi:hypothetical protein